MNKTIWGGAKNGQKNLGKRGQAQKIVKKIWGKGAKLIDNIYKD